MAIQSVFQRHEIKYLIHTRQYHQILQAMEEYMEPDPYPRCHIRNVYYDTSDYRLIRASLEKPVYKEKLRLRSYGPISQEDTVFLELKKKYRSVVYKRRISLPHADAEEIMARGIPLPQGSQIAREIDYVRRFYPHLAPGMYLSYHREAWRERDGGEFRVTFDHDLLARTRALTLSVPPFGTALLDEDQYLMEVKAPGAIPLWMVRTLSQLGIYKTSFSKYGIAYQRLILQPNQGGFPHDIQPIQRVI
ncbi:polyphosphate polymerase domain-containing protein [Pseudoflavonifractor sp. An85]|uniref:polyphosphate polymerase domain-containing protein n=1 Tax=Pseudoflavonifractor sp. An85 TaxID=1965661 RepID=UPI000B3AF9E1|nr:polyphosphate polymerase domain-containing protein [Pseudoflavonifractor sp. An85]OUN22170.1 molecular chaperone [Pseudoflavonifractor sp. An85]